MTHRVLLVEDDALIVSTLTELLEGVGYEVVTADTQMTAIRRALTSQEPAVSLVLLDVTLAKGSGFAVCAAIKQVRPQLPVIFLTASDNEFNTVAGIQMGADDYIAKPFRPRELLARVAAVLRRSYAENALLSLGPLSIDVDRARVERNGVEIPLSALEYKMLLLFANNAGKLVTREMIREELWDDAGAYIEDNTLSVYIKRLRGKIEDDPVEPRIIVTVRGLGYKVMA
ncbi:response regulator transcription factor [Collinsella sp. zg1085]|uniref:response regulator transcription factor n=1 Tax=Collinsella sp. zg1085 TaxID=2844380 RepID=UPI001C0C9AE7|nr:response regulator transcription factor [Collinsella sp. zg1085]QWT17154.1 response regulator transcription factor [Collinsella sp. zg1085]